MERLCFILLFNTLCSTIFVSGDTLQINDLVRVVSSLQNQLNQLQEQSHKQLQQLEEKSRKETENLKSEISSLNKKLAAQDKKVKELDFIVTTSDFTKGPIFTDASNHALDTNSMDAKTSAISQIFTQKTDSAMKHSKVEISVRKDVLKGKSPSPRQVEYRVAFHVQLSGNRDLGTGTIVVYDTKLLDIGGGYNHDDGIYIVPEAGVYVMTWTTISLEHSFYTTNLVVNGSPHGSTVADSMDISDVHTATGVVVLLLNQNDHVFIRVHNKRGTMLSDPYIHGVSTFSGWMLK